MRECASNHSDTPRGLCTYTGGCQEHHKSSQRLFPWSDKASCLHSTNSRLAKMCSILSHRELQKPLRTSSAVNLVLTGAAWSSKGWRMAGVHWATQPGLLSWGTAN